MARQILNPLGISRWDGDEFTHVKKPYRAKCYQITSDNLERLKADLHDFAKVSAHQGNSVIVRWFDHQDDRSELEWISFGSAWLRIGENGTRKIIKNQEFLEKYVTLGGNSDRAQDKETR